MKHYRNIILLVAILMAGSLAASKDAPTAAPLPLTDNTAPPYIGVWEPMYQGTGATDGFAKWLNRKALFSVVTQYVLDSAGWPATPDKYWVDPQWGKWVAEVPGRRALVILSLPTDSTALEKGAKGGNNESIAAIAKYLVANNLGNSILCMGLINTPNTWDAATAADAANFVQCWRQMVTAVRAVPGADKLQFDWVGMNRKTSFPIESAYPGDEYVDYVGMILYDQCLDKNIYPFPANATEDEKRTRQKQAWEQYYYPAAQNGLATWVGVAKAHNKPFSIPCWCLYSDHYADGTLSTGEDNPYFIQQMHDFIQDPANNVSFAAYMDTYWDCTRISSSKEYTTNYPKAAARFHELFALPAGATRP